MTLLHDTSPPQRLWHLIRDIRFGMLTTRHGDGQLRSRPMTTQNRVLDDAQPVLWFFVSRRSEPGVDLQDDGAVNIAYASPDKDRYVSISGYARFVQDPARVRELWNTAAEAWFPAGPDDPDLGLLAVHIEHAEYWDVQDSKMVQLFKMARAAVTGRRPDLDSEHTTVRLG